jgi:hypothetical protein
VSWKIHAEIKELQVENDPGEADGATISDLMAYICWDDCEGKAGGEFVSFKQSGARTFHVRVANHGVGPLHVEDFVWRRDR